MTRLYFFKGLQGTTTRYCDSHSEAIRLLQNELRDSQYNQIFYKDYETETFQLIYDFEFDPY